jgi:hypothetical protein
LFIDEAYSLSEGGQGDFGKEAISTISVSVFKQVPFLS